MAAKKKRMTQKEKDFNRKYKKELQENVWCGKCGLAELHAVFRPDRSIKEHGGKDGKRGWKMTRNC